jgi:hypothetical protein
MVGRWGSISGIAVLTFLVVRETVVQAFCVSLASALVSASGLTGPPVGLANVGAAYVQGASMTNFVAVDGCHALAEPSYKRPYRFYLSG